MSTSFTLDNDLAKLRKVSIQLRERRVKLQALLEPTDEDLAELEELRVAINTSRKEERFLSGRIKLLKG